MSVRFRAISTNCLPFSGVQVVVKVGINIQTLAKAFAAMLAKEKLPHASYRTPWHWRLPEVICPMSLRQAVSHLAPDSVASAKAVGLNYVSDAVPGFSRKRNGKGFSYFNIRGGELRDPSHLRRIKSLAIPPAWRAVWICPDAQGHLQATGRDARG